MSNDALKNTEEKNTSKKPYTSRVVAVNVLILIAMKILRHFGVDIGLSDSDILDLVIALNVILRFDTDKPIKWR